MGFCRGLGEFWGERMFLGGNLGFGAAWRDFGVRRSDCSVILGENMGFGGEFGVLGEFREVWGNFGVRGCVCRV